METWSKTRKGGVNGFYSVVLALSFWLNAATSDLEKTKCEEAICDVFWVSDQMIATQKPSSKRASPDEGGESVPTKRYFHFIPIDILLLKHYRSKTE
jgi:hypothetical protein